MRARLLLPRCGLLALAPWLQALWLAAVAFADFDVDEYIKSFGDLEGRPDALEQREKQRVDPRIPEAGKFIDSAKEKETGGDLDAAESDYNDAIDTLKGTKESKGMLTAGYFARGRFWEKRGEDKSAVRDFSRAIKHLDKNNTSDKAHLYSHRGAARHRLEQHKAAVSDYDKALEIVEQRLQELSPEAEAARISKLLAKAGAAESKAAEKDVEHGEGEPVPVEGSTEKAIETNSAEEAAGEEKGGDEPKEGQQLQEEEEQEGGESDSAEGIAASVQKAKEDMSTHVEWQDAKDRMEHAELSAFHAGWQTNRGLVLADMGNHEGALEAHTLAIARSPSVTAAWSNRAGARGTTSTITSSYTYLSAHPLAVTVCIGHSRGYNLL